MATSDISGYKILIQTILKHNEKEALRKNQSRTNYQVFTV